MNTQSPICVWQVGAELGEGPVWQPNERAVYFVDIKGRYLHRLSVETGEKVTWQAPSEPGFVLPLADDAFICGLRDGLYRFDSEDGKFSKMVSVEAHLAGNRLNDGFVDFDGHLWFGSMDDSEKRPTGALYRLEDSGKVTTRDAGYVITNGPATSPDNRTLYHTDTLKKVLYAFDVNERGELSHRRVFIAISGTGYPDGMAVDADGFIWVALFGGGRVERYAPDGRLVDQVYFPCSNITKLAFGGDDLCTAYVTTARKGLSPEEIRQQPLAGGLFSFRTDTPGKSQVRCVRGLAL
ncbi:MAG: SMP-30/gluconolactonase/LRE family protein [Paraburkholderia sp.]|uniref:SMP-30/gluconolactonase/LRE family protein n=1 Tax=Paraburkholderia sp. TaxID=1926495 RepID=UPI0012089A16|nr:SMP-30/gluconolactonase/LRE family protein [Paraburkholderia sp.]TAL98689.1 MAG: SMP-30/gluconolactonase/LRE family protein [Paraburkholderia sp.]